MKFAALKNKLLRGMVMIELISRLHRILSYIKGFAAGYGSPSNNQMMIDHNGKRYMVTFEELCDAEDEDMFKTMEKYWRL